MLMSFGRPQGLVFVRTVAKFGFRRVLYKRKWTFRPFFLGKGTFFAHSFEESELFCTQFFRRKWTSQAHFFFFRKWTFFCAVNAEAKSLWGGSWVRFPGKLKKIPLTPPWLRACLFLNFSFFSKIPLFNG